MTRRYSIIILLAAGLALSAPSVFASSSVAFDPAVIDLSGEPREFLKTEVTITNNGKFREQVYPTVRDLTADDGAPPFKQLIGRDRAASLANWIDMPRQQILLDPGESVKVPINIQINLWAEPGEYHAILAFPSGRNRTIAEETIISKDVTILNVKVIDDAREALSILEFAAPNSLSGSEDLAITYVLENGGNRDETPTGSIILYDRRGREVGELPLNPENITIEPGNSTAMSSVWSATLGTGRYKAYLDLDYGSVNAQSLQDTMFFWVIPLPMLSIVLILLLAASFLFVSVWHRRYLARHRIRVDDWHRESANRHASVVRRQKIKGLPESPHRSEQSEKHKTNSGPIRKGNTLDLRNHE